MKHSKTQHWQQYQWMKQWIITARKRSLGQDNIFRSVCQEFCSGRGWYPSMPCRSPGPHPRGKLRGLAWGGSPGPHPGGVLQAHTGGYTSMHWGRHPPSRWLLLRAVRILLECILVTTWKRSLGQYSIFTGVCLSTGGGGSSVWCQFLSGCLVPCSF